MEKHYKGGVSSREARGSLLTFHPDLPRVSSLTNDNHCVSQLQGRLLTQSTTQEQTLNTLIVNLPVIKVVTSAPGHSQKKDVSPGGAGCQYKDQKLKFVKSVSCVTQLSCVKPVTCAQNVVPNQPVGARLQNFWKIWLELGAGPKVVQILKEGYTLPFRIRPYLTRSPSVISCYVNLHRNSDLSILSGRLKNLKDVDKWSSLSLYLQVRGMSVTCELGLYLYSQIG